MSKRVDPLRGMWRWDSEKMELIPLSSIKPMKIFGQAPMVIGDEMKAVECMADGRTYTSRSEYNKAIKAAGFESTGGAKQMAADKRKDPEKRRKEIEDDIAKAYTMVRDGMAPLTEKEKHLCKENNERIKKAK